MSRSTPIALLLLSTLLFSAPSQAQTYACVVTNMGEFCIKFLRDDAPNTVNNFLNYVNRGAYDETFFHRTSPGYAIDAGTYKLDPLGEKIPEDPPIANEFKVSNTRGTVAMAKLPGEPDSATSQWFVNLTNNSSTLDQQDGGATVFAKVVKGMDVVEAIGGALRVNLSATLGEDFGMVPVRVKRPDGVELDDLVQIKRAYATDDVIEDVDNSAEEAARLYACTADWVAEIQPREVCMETNMGNMCMDLMPEVASKTVANFLHYVADRDYDGTFIHRGRDITGLDVLQGGGFRTSPLFSSVPSDPAIENEYSTPNTRGTVAMAKGSDPDSATSQWFINTIDNSSALGAENNGGYTVFARVREADMGVVDQIIGLDSYNLSDYNAAFNFIPMRRIAPEGGLSLNDFVLIKRAYIPGHEVNPCLPPKGVATVEFSNRLLILPVRMKDGQIYEFRLTQAYTLEGFVFQVNLSMVRILKDIGQEVATYSAEEGLLRIPSVYVAANGRVIYNVRLRLTDPSTLDFTLEGFDKTPPSP